MLQGKTPPAQVAAGVDHHECRWSICASWWKETPPAQVAQCQDHLGHKSIGAWDAATKCSLHKGKICTYGGHHLLQPWYIATCTYVSRSCDPSKVLTCRRANLIWCHIWYTVTVQFKQVALYCTPGVTTSPVTQSTFRSRVSTCKCTNRLQLCIAYTIGKMKLSKSIYAELICLKSDCRTFWLCRSLSAACKRPVRLYVMW